MYQVAEENCGAGVWRPRLGAPDQEAARSVPRIYASIKGAVQNLSFV